MNEAIKQLTESTVRRDLAGETSALVKKWQKFGLLEGLSGRRRDNMARLLENQAGQLLKEASSMASGDIAGYSQVAFPLVRRVFDRLYAQELVSVQAMSLPSGLVFFLDFTISGDRAGTAAGENRLGFEAGDSVYGQGRVASQITGGVILTGESFEDGFYNFNNGYSSATGSATPTLTVVASGTVGGTFTGTAAYVALGDGLLRYDPDVLDLSGTHSVVVATAPISTFAAAQFDEDNLVSINFSSLTASASQVRRLTVLDPTQTTPTKLMFVVTAPSGTTNADALETDVAGTQTASFVIRDNLNNVGDAALGAVIGATSWGLEAEERIPEVDIKVESVSIDTKTEKLKAKWSPELGQDVNAYHDVDMESEMTNLLSEIVSQNVDNKILEDLVKGATAGTRYWSRSPGKFLNSLTGAPASTTANESLFGADFTGNVSQWYETLIEQINDVSAQIHRKTLRGGANFIVVSPEVANILEFTAGFRASVTHDDEKGEIGVQRVGSISRKFEVYVDATFLRNVVLIGRKGSSFLESGYVYAPYVPLQVTPTILGTEDFQPRLGVMQRAGYKMLRPDYYGLVIIRDFLKIQ